MTFVPVVPLLLMLTADPAFQAPREPPPPAVASAPRLVTALSEQAIRERELRTVVASGSARRETFVELALLMIQQNRFEDAIVALRGAAAAPAARFAEAFDQTVARLQPVRVGGGDVRTPIKLKDVKPVYPPIAQSARVQGAVRIDAVIDEAGHVVNARVIGSIPLLDGAALDAVSRWEFLRNDAGGRPVPVVMTVTVNFVMR
jgi:TonB family protein